ncbi:MAG: MurR/RpiR family transcriptional regulator [Tissierellales bacterium]|nr:MurR/RpiR family transcriptional regulator [Tissierellales bacterium]MBN2826908.1 MurR/RpiR family transcriptional regulator [Tissierellales bacterium]
MSLENNADLIKLIQSHYPKFSKGQKAIAQFIIEHYERAAFMTASKIGQTVDVSESTVVRFATALGFDGYPELQKSLQVMIKNKLTTVQRISLNEAQDDSDEFIRRVLKNEVNSLRNYYEELDEKRLDKASDLILGARKIYILGMRVSYTLALYLGFYLDVILENVKVMNLGSNSLFEQMVRINEDDLFVIISYPRYSKQSLDAVNFAKERNAKILAITDTESSPFYSISDVALLGKSNMVSFIDSLVTPMAVINSLITSVGLKEKQDIVKYFDLLEDVWDKYSIYNKPIHDSTKK